MTEELITFETAKLAKEKGFDEECMHRWEWYKYNKDERGPNAIGTTLMDFRKWGIPLEQTQLRPMLYNKVFWPKRNSELQPWLYARPTQELLEMWLREKFDVWIETRREIDTEFPVVQFRVLSKQTQVIIGLFKTYHVGREVALRHALKELPDVELKRK